LICFQAFSEEILKEYNIKGKKSDLYHLIKKVEKEKLYDDKYWWVLLHYKKNLFGNVESEIDDKNFFLAPDGKYNPKNELIYTIKAFFSNKTHSNLRKSEPIECAFIARYKWLRKKLNFPKIFSSKVKCIDYEKWKRLLKPESISIVFASYYTNNPASLFGHTFLKVNYMRGEKPSLLDYAFSYGANPDTHNIFLYVFKGIFGGFKGTFVMRPYFVKVKEYNDMESRDLWEYELNLNKDEVERLMDHLWELGDTFFYYYYFDENCSYHLLSLLEVARPSVNLRNEFFFVVHPSETVKVIYRKKMVNKVFFRPSFFTEYISRMKMLSSEERNILGDIIWKGKFSKTFFSLSNKRKAILLDAAIFYLLYKEKQKTELYEKVLSERRKLDVVYKIDYRDRISLANPINSLPPAHLCISFGELFERNNSPLTSI
jgi:hypothetical protein